MSQVTTQPPSPLQQDTTLTALIAGIINDAQRLLSQQIELVRVEIKEDLRKTVTGVACIAAGAGLLLVGGLLLCFMVVYLLHWAFPALELWVCFLIVGGFFALLGASLVFVAIQRFRSFNPLPDQSLQGLKENLQWKTNLK
jgi:hypothetical protein